MENTDIKMLEKYKKRIKTQNEAAKENWDMVSCRLPKGTKNRIKALGLSVNGVINKSVLSFLESAEKEHKEELERLEAQKEPQETYQTKQDAKQEKEEAKPTNNNQEAKPMTLADAQAILDRKIAEQKERKEMLEKAKQERIEQEESERRAEINNIIDRIIGVDDSDDSDKKQ